MSTVTARSAYSNWPLYNRRRATRSPRWTDEQLSIRPSPSGGRSGRRGPYRVPTGVLALRVAGEPGAETTPFPDALHYCRRDEDLEHVLNADALVGALDSTFRIVESCLDRWTPEMLDEEIRRRFSEEESVHTRGFVIQRVFSHDVYHCAELNETLGGPGGCRRLTCGS
ncbi:MAG: hypothetical protein M3301_09595, partial [Chloroflexota bacterium]|nr:hypothetical protein [Chloroflexota bacterium]